ncbi:AI-2E family transporter [Anaerolentibacter hominis]|uniref:AI-2E family transporter n=1 Tax=Anaerolentibacter hominis TaxID=3079009 RepID=UPI0031B8610A
MKDQENFKKYLYAGLTALAVIGAGLILIFIVFKMGTIKDSFRWLAGILSPFIYGFVIAYLLVPVFNRTQRGAAKVLRRQMSNERTIEKISKITATLASVLFIVLIVGGLLAIIIPQVAYSIMSIVGDIPQMINKIQTWFENIFVDNPQLEETAVMLSEKVLTYFQNWATKDLMPQLNTFVGGLSSGIYSTLMVMKNIVIGLIIAVYMLNMKDKFACQGKKVAYSCMKIDWANEVIGGLRHAHQVFGGFISGKLLDSLIIGILCFIGMTVFNMPYAMLISIIIGVTNIIPFFGPFIGAIPSALLVLIVNPIQCIYFVLFILVLQQIDGNIIGPKILGDSTGLPGFWVMFAILLFGGLFGFVGMIVGVPTFAIIYSFITFLVKRSLSRKHLPVETEEYENLERIEPDGSVVFKRSNEKGNEEGIGKKKERKGK